MMRKRRLVPAIAVIAVLVAGSWALLRSVDSKPTGCSDAEKAQLVAGSRYLSSALPGLRVGAYYDADCDSGDRASMDLKHSDVARVESLLRARCGAHDFDGEYVSTVCNFGNAEYEVVYWIVRGAFEGELYLK